MRVALRVGGGADLEVAALALAGSRGEAPALLLDASARSGLVQLLVDELDDELRIRAPHQLGSTARRPPAIRWKAYPPHCQRPSLRPSGQRALDGA